jgi:hypothetical protein
MTKATSLTILVTLLGLCLQIAPAGALGSTFVSAASGSNANDCSRAAPCRTFARALNQTNPGGEIKVLDPGDYGAVTITKSVHIVGEAPGEAAIVVGSGDPAVVINAGANDVVGLRGITIRGGRNTGVGIVFNSGRALIVDGCVIRNLIGTGIAFHPDTSASLAVLNTIVTNVGGRGIHVSPSGGATGSFSAIVSRSEVHGTTDIGIFAHGTGSAGVLKMTVSDSVSTGSPGSGIRANSLLGSTTTLTVVRSVSANNGTGISAANSNALVRVGQSTITGNTNGWLAENGATLQSYGDNYVNGNSANEGVVPGVSPK